MTTHVSGGGGGSISGLTSDDANGIRVAAAITGGDDNATPIPSYFKFNGITKLRDTLANITDEYSILWVLQSQSIPAGATAPEAVFIQRVGDVSFQDYAFPAVIIQDSTPSAQPVLRVVKQGNTVLELTTRKSITGPLSAIADGSTKTVLTSIVDALTGIKVATDNTT